VKAKLIKENIKFNRIDSEEDLKKEMFSTKFIKLKNITTEVPRDAIQITNLNQLEEGDFILKIWDNRKFPGGVEANNRTFAKVIKIDIDSGWLTYGGHWNNSYENYNAGTCTSGHFIFSDENKNFPHVIFKILDPKF